ncbi:Hypothetical predicted protein [Olea europaea subsp. europaea]|uniref:Uncharacterized protein n=1 Tax=Olea europaea subsp. europaea TaxID=158383 RepID=A0A8S0VMF6_OLEEU|nr:Hypothetical predicted protein [Olea europaea subsp. europaea]
MHCFVAIVGLGWTEQTWASSKGDRATSPSCSPTIANEATGRQADPEARESDCELLYGAAYGACVNARYLEVEKDMCKEQFAAFKNCVTKAVSEIPDTYVA